MLCMAVVGAATAASAFLVKPAMDDIFLNRDESMLVLIPIAVIIIYLLKGACNYGQTILMNFIGLRIVADLRSDLYRNIQRQSLVFFTKNPTGILMSRITNDVTYIQGAVSEAVTSLLKDSFTLVCLVFVIFYRDWQLAIIAMFVFPLAVYPIAKFGRRMRQDRHGVPGHHGQSDHPAPGDDLGNPHRQGLQHGGVRKPALCDGERAPVQPHHEVRLDQRDLQPLHGIPGRPRHLRPSSSTAAIRSSPGPRRRGPSSRSSRR